MDLSARGDSHATHLSTEAGLLSIHTEHVQLSEEGFGGGFMPAAAQSNPPDAGLDAED